MNCTNCNKKGFTLVELSIVLVIIGLIVAGVTAGSTMVGKAKFRSVISDINKFTTAAYAFKTQYGALPGDMPNAKTDYWSAANANGNGDGIVTESWGFWQHLALSGYIPGVYSGVAGSGVFQPNSPIANGFYMATSAGSTTAMYGKSGNLFLLANNNAVTGCTYGCGGVIFPEDASYAIDLKMDDGIANTGNVYGLTPYDVAGAGTECVASGQWGASNSATGGNYNLSIKNRYCRMAFWY